MSRTEKYILKMNPVERIIYRSILRNNKVGIEKLKMEAKQNA